MVSSSPRWSTTITAREFVQASLAVHAAVFALRFSYVWLDDLVRDLPKTFWPRLIEEATGAGGAAMLSWLVFVMWRRAPLREERWWYHVPAYLLLGVLLSVANTSFMWATRTLLFPAAGLGAYDYGRMPLRYLMELPSSLIGFVTLLAMLALAEETRVRRLRQAEQLELERALAQSQLRSLQLQLQPHFLFNALNTISAQLHEDPVGADRLIGRLADLLRASMRSAQDAKVPLREELSLLEDYAELMRARFGERLDLDIRCEPEDAPERPELLVPPLLLQPLVENAIRHGALERDGTGRIRVRIVRTGAALLVHVHDNGPGMPANRNALVSGTGLSTTARRLELMYGPVASLDAGNAPDGGFSVTIRLPAS